MAVPLGLLVWLSSLAVAAGSRSQVQASPSAPAGDEPPRVTPGQVIRAVAEEVALQAPAERRDALKRVLLWSLTRGNPYGAQLAIPVDLEGAPASRRISELAVAIGQAWEYPLDVSEEEVLSGDGVTCYPVVLITAGKVPPGTDWIGQEQAEAFGGIIDTIVQTVISSAVGTVTSMGVQSLVNSAGGEKRLARVVRHYKSAKERGDEASASAIREKITRTASRIKGRQVDWSEVEAIIES